MKYIPLRVGERFNTAAVIEAVVGGPAPQKVEAMRQRVRILDALAKADPVHMLIEDADHKHLAELVNNFQFGVAHPELLGIIDEILDAKEPPKILMPAANDRDKPL